MYDRAKNREVLEDPVDTTMDWLQENMTLLVNEMVS